MKALFRAWLWLLLIGYVVLICFNVSNAVVTGDWGDLPTECPENAHSGEPSPSCVYRLERGESR